jgi:alpha-ribazole phosphatase
MKLILVRHPQPLVAPGVCYGSSDLPIAPGHLEQTMAALKLPTGLPIYASPLRRCAELAARLTSSPHYDHRLVEMHFGEWEMQAWDAIPRAAIDAWAADMVHYHPGGGESVLQMARRIDAFYGDLQRQHTEAIIICHAGAMRLLAARHAGHAPMEMALHAAQTAHQIPYGAMLTLKPV